MSLIPYISKEQSKITKLPCSYVESAAGFDMNSDKVMIQNIDESQVEEFSKESNSTYDLRVGSEYWDSFGFRSIAEGGKIDIKPNKFFCVKTIEHIQIPKTRFGMIVSKVSSLAKGYGVTTTKIDPGYNGELVIYVYNYSPKSVSLKYGEKFCSLIIIDSAKGIIPYNKIPKQTPRIKEMSWWDRIDKLLLISIIALIISLFILLRDLTDLKIFGWNDGAKEKNNIELQDKE
jgi:dCTP deaminase